MRVCDVRRARCGGVQISELAAKFRHDLPRAVGGHVVRYNDDVAEARDIAQRLLDEPILVPHERDSHDAHDVSALGRPLEDGRARPPATAP